MASHSPQGGAFKVAHHWKYFLFLSLVCLSAIQTGLSSNVVSSASSLIESYMRLDSGISQSRLSAASRALQYLLVIGRITGFLVPVVFGRWLGRKPALWIACGLTFMSNIMVQLSTTITPFRAGVFFTGISHGIFEAYAQLYIVECSPERYRSLSIFVFTALNTFGSLVSSLMFMGLESVFSRTHPYQSLTLLPVTTWGYVIPLGVLYILPSLLAVGLFFVPESPRWLALKNKPAKAEEALAWLRPQAWTVVHELQQITAAIVVDETRPGTIWADYVDLLASRGRLRTLLSLAAAILPAATGFEYVNSAISSYIYASLFGGSGSYLYWRTRFSLIIVGTTVAFLLIMGAISVPIGRRRAWLMASMGIVGIAQLVIAALTHNLSYYETSFGHAGGNSISAMFIILFYLRQAVLGYSSATAAEFPSQRLRSYTYGLALAVGLFFEWLVSFTLSDMFRQWSTQYGYLWAAACFVSVIWMYFFFPETKGRTLEEIDEIFEANVSARKFSSYTCVGFATGGVPEGRLHHDSHPDMTYPAGQGGAVGYYA